MNLKSKFLIASSIALGLSISSFAQPYNVALSGMLYSVGLDYSNSLLKKDGYIFGAYGNLGIGWVHQVEMGYEHTYINYKDNTDLNQNDYTVVYNNYSIPNRKFRAGIHYIDSDDKNTDGGFTLIFGAGMFQPYKWDANVDLYYTNYGDYVLPNGGKGISVYQISPNVGFGVGNYYTTGRLYLKTIATYIRHSDNVGFGKNFSSIEEKVYYYKGPLTLGAFAWFGERSFMVDNGGFTVFNLKEKYKHGYGVSATYKFNYLGYGMYVTGSVSKLQFKEVGNPKDVDFVVYGLSGGLLF